MERRTSSSTRRVSGSGKLLHCCALSHVTEQLVDQSYQPVHVTPPEAGTKLLRVAPNVEMLVLGLFRQAFFFSGVETWLCCGFPTPSPVSAQQTRALRATTALAS